jgi:hypothetical protein
MSFASLRLLLLATVLSGCGAATIDQHYDAALAAADESAASQFVYATCPSSEIGPSCGLILRHTAGDAFRERFRVRACKEKTPEACEDAYQRSVEAELGRRYFLADWAGVARQCDLSTPTCDDVVVYEKMLVQSHNDVVRMRSLDREAQIEAERREAKARATRVALATAGEIAFALHPGPKCRTYPSVFSGVTNTVCTR